MTDPGPIPPLAEYLLRRKTAPTLTVALDGIDAAGKTTLADALRAELEARGQRVLRASIDGFHNPSAIRRARGSLSPEGYYFDALPFYQRRGYQVFGELRDLPPGQRRIFLWKSLS